MLQYLIIQFLLYYLSSGRLIKGCCKKKKSTFLALNMITVAFKMWSLTRGFKFSGLTWKTFLYLKQLVTDERWSQREIRLYFDQHEN